MLIVTIAVASVVKLPKKDPDPVQPVEDQPDKDDDNDSHVVDPSVSPSGYYSTQQPSTYDYEQQQQQPDEDGPYGYEGSYPDQRISSSKYRFYAYNR